ncbi:DUF3693 domain-containing protein [Vibrio sp. AK197]
MYSNELLNAYKKAQNYVQDKQIAHDLNLDPSKISKIRNGIRQLTDDEAVFLANGAGIEPHIALLGCHSDRNENPKIKAMWEEIAKKYNGLGLSRISAAYAGLTVAISTHTETLSQYALCILC